MTPEVNDYLKTVLAGGISGAASLFSGDPDSNGSQMLAGKLEHRIVERSDGLDPAGVDSLTVFEIGRLFQAHRRDDLM